MANYSIGIDFGTLSARAILVDVSNGNVLASEEFVYPHGVLDSTLPDGTELDTNSAFQHPKDYLDALEHTVKGVMQTSGVCPADVVGLGIDFTACTMLAVDASNTPLCFYDAFRGQPHAYAKLWKHPAPQPEADEINRLAIENNQEWLGIYGGKISSEWLFPKMLETLHKAPEVFHHTAYFVEAGDWLTWILTGKQVRSSCMSGFKGMWNKKTGYPAKDFLKKIAFEFENIAETKLAGEILPTGSKAGTLNEYGCKLTGLLPRTAVAVPIIDAHASLPAAGIAESGKLMLILGTSSCQIILDQEDREVHGISGRVTDGVYPGYVAYESGQAAVGDSFDWYIKNCVPYSYAEKAKEEGKNIFTYITEKADALPIGKSGLVALDWWNGNRVPYADGDLTGGIIGFTLSTRPEEIYRAILESTAFGTKAICDIYENSGIVISEVYASGGISQKNKFMMQMYADVLGKPIRVPNISQAGAMGSAIFAAYAGGTYDSISQAVNTMVNVEETIYIPNLENTEKYAPLYRKYLKISNYFAVENPNLMKK